MWGQGAVSCPQHSLLPPPAVLAVVSDLSVKTQALFSRPPAVLQLGGSTPQWVGLSSTVSPASKAGLNLVWPVPCSSSNGLNQGGQPSLGSRHIQSTTPPSTKLGRGLRLLWAPVRLFSLGSVGGVSVTMAEWTPSNTREKVWVLLQGIPAWPPTSIACVETRRVFSRGARPTFTPDHTEGGEPALSQTQEDRRTERLSACPAVVLGSCVGDTLWELAGPPCLGHWLHQTEGVTLEMEGGREHAWCVLSGSCLSL